MKECQLEKAIECQDLVSVVMVFLNMDRFIAEAIDSVLEQTHENWELFLVDDGSTDGSTTTAQEYAERYAPRIKYVQHADHGNRGCSASRNAGINLASGEYITFIDADDVWVNHKLADQVAIMQAHPEIGMVSGARRHWSSWAGGTDFFRQAGHVQGVVVFPPEALLTVNPLGQAFPPDVGALIRRELVISLGGFEEEFPALYEDAAFFVKLYLVAAVYFAPNVWLHYRQHPGSIVSTVRREGRIGKARWDFLRWLYKYARTRSVDPRVSRAIRGALLQQILSSLKARPPLRQLLWMRRTIRNSVQVRA